MSSVMCGRSTYKVTWEEIVALYRLTLDQPARNTRARYNVCPTTTIDTIMIAKRYCTGWQASRRMMPRLSLNARTTFRMGFLEGTAVLGMASGAWRCPTS